MLAAIGLSGCALDRPLHVRVRGDVRVPSPSVIVFFADGVSVDHLDAMLRRRQLPHIREIFIEEGVRVRRAVTSIPSLTYPNAISMLTGRFPSSHGVLGNQWFDPAHGKMEHYTTLATYQNSNKHFDALTIFEVIDDRLTAAVQLHTHRGADLVIEHPMLGGLNWLLGDYMAFDRRGAQSIENIAAYANRAGEWPALTVLYFPGIDEIAHRFGVDSPEYAAALRNLDVQIGRVEEALDRVDLDETTYFVLTSDHGHVRCDGPPFDVAAWLRQETGRPVYYEPDMRSEAARRPGGLAGDEIVLSINASRIAAVHLRSRSGWGTPADAADVVPLAAELARQRHPAVELIAVRQPGGGVRIWTTGGDAVLQRVADGAEEAADAEGKLVATPTSGRKDHWRGDRRNAIYRVRVERGDPLFADGRPELSDVLTAGAQDARTWLAASVDSRYPDLVPQLVEYFRFPRAADILLFASDHGAFDALYESGHGSCLAGDMMIPMFFAGPGLPEGGRIEQARLVDLAPTLLELLGLEDRVDRMGDIDGVSLAERLRSAETADSD